MSRSLNKAILIGNVGSDPEIRTVGTGGKVANFSLATSRTWNDQSGTKQEKTEWHRCVVWNAGKTGSGLADVVERYVKKGEKIYVEGEIEYRQWQDKDNQTRYTTEIRVRELMLLGGRTGEDGGPHDWIYILESFGALKRAHGWGTTAHHLGVIVMAGSIAWAGWWLWKKRPSPSA